MSGASSVQQQEAPSGPAERRTTAAAQADQHAFDTISIGTLSGADPAMLDSLPFGVIGLSAAGVVEIYNATESRLAGLPVARIIGQRFFEHIAQCMNNFLVAQRFIDEPEIDTIIDFVLTLKMRPTQVKLRLLQSAGHALHFVLVERAL